MDKSIEKLKLVYEGESLESGLINAKDLAENILAFSNIINRTNTLLNLNAKVNIKIQATNKGSFEVVFLLEMWEAIKNFLTSSDYQALKEIIILLFGSGTSAFAGLILLYKHLKGKKAKSVINKKNGTTIVINYEDVSLSVFSDSLILYNDLEMRTSLKRFAKDTLEKDGIDTIKISTSSSSIEIAKEEKNYFDVISQENQETQESKYKATFSIISLTFKEDNKWTLHDGNSQIKATIEDKDFLHKIDKGLISFAKYDKLTCEVLLKQIINEKLPRNEYTIIKVIQHIPSLKQTSFI